VYADAPHNCFDSVVEEEISVEDVVVCRCDGFAVWLAGFGVEDGSVVVAVV
jgi:hypothetical protein